MADLHQLENKMRTIKLSGMVETLNMRLDQAQKEGMAFTQFLEILLEDEVQHRANKRLATRIIRARFEEEKNLEGFDFNFNPKLPAGYIRELATCQFIERKESVILCGPVGVGKTHLAQALGHQACRAGYNVLFIKAGRLLSDLGGGRADDSWEKRLLRIPVKMGHLSTQSGPAVEKDNIEELLERTNRPYLSKPFTPDELRSIVRETLRRVEE